MDLEKLKSELVRDEGLKTLMYYDSVGVPTVGVGHNMLTPLSRSAVLHILEDDISSHMNELDVRLPWWRGLDEVRQRVIANMAFNLGVDGLLGFKQTLKAVYYGEYEKASVLMLMSKWATQVGDRAKRLSKMMRTGLDE